MNDISPFIKAAKEVKDCYITHSAVQTALSELRDIHLTGSDAILIGEPGLGKTTTLKKYRDRYLSSGNNHLHQNSAPCSVVIISMPPILTVKNFVEVLLRGINAPILNAQTRLRLEDLLPSLITLIGRRNVTMIMIDEFQNLLGNSRVKSSKAILETIKLIKSETAVSIVLTGTPQGWEDLRLHDDNSATQRWSHHIKLQPFSMSSADETRRFKSFLKTMSNWLADKDIDASCLLANDMPARIFKCTGGIPREIATLLRLALTDAYHAASDNRLELQHFQAAFPKLQSNASSKLRTNPFRR
ncbi:MAG: AAA family ATPase [Oceanospirillales bacterium]|nr:AAA family ATPase [Oceanospirillales bacterium]